MQPMPWGTGAVVGGVVSAAVLHIVAIMAIEAAAEALGRPTSFRDVGDIFAKAGAIAAYVDERLQAVATGGELPVPPQILGDTVTARIAYLVGILNLLGMAAIAVVASRRGPGRFARELGLTRYDPGDAWLPVGLAVGAVVLLAVYAAAVRALGVEWLQPGDAVPGPVLRDGLTLALFGLVSVGVAPFVEELFFRGLVFGGLLQFGAVPAAALSSVLFAAWHLDVGALVPITAIGLVMAWLAWSRATLWDAIIFHLAFNAAGFVPVAGAFA